MWCDGAEVWWCSGMVVLWCGGVVMWCSDVIVVVRCVVLWCRGVVLCGFVVCCVHVERLCCGGVVV